MDRMTVTIDIRDNNIGPKHVNLRSSLVVANLIATIKDKFNLDGNYVLRLEGDRYKLPDEAPLDQTAAREGSVLVCEPVLEATGTLDAIHDALRRKLRAAGKPHSPRTTASADSQSVDTTSGGEARGRDNHKNVDGRKRHIVVDSMGLLLAVLVTAADVDDAAAAAALFGRLGGQPVSKVRRVFADNS